MANPGTRVRPRQEDIDAFQLARMWAVKRCPYFADVLYALVPVYVRGSGTFSVDGYGRLYMDVVALGTTWNQEQAGSVLIHEAGHVLRDHYNRLTAPGIDHKLANVATDMEVNDDIDWLPLPDFKTPDVEVAAGKPAIIPYVHPRNHNFPEGLLAEEYYKLLKLKSIARSGPRYVMSVGDGDGDDGNSPIMAPGCGSGSGGVPLECELPATESEVASLSELQQASLRIRVANNIRALPPGTVPGGWDEWAQELVEPKVNWKRVLRGKANRMVDHVTAESENTWTRANRRSASIKPLMLPGEVYNDTTVAIVLDTSGSMDCDHALDSALSELKGLFKQREVKVSVVACDAEVSQVRNISSLSELGDRRSGGTDMRVGIDTALGLFPRPSMVVVLTDGYTPWPDVPTKVPLLACLVGSNPPVNDVPQWMRVVVVDEPAPVSRVTSSAAPGMVV